jgi:hypothetical protein
MRSEEWHHSFGQLLDTSDAELHAVTVVDGDLAAPEEPSKLLEEGNISLMLHHADSGRTCQPTFIVGCRLMPT